MRSSISGYCVESLVANTLSDCRESEYFVHRSFVPPIEISQHVKIVLMEVSTVMNRPIDEAFAFVANFENHPKMGNEFSAEMGIFDNLP